MLSRLKFMFFCLLLLVAISPVLVLDVSANPAPWSIGVVDSPQNVGKGSSMALDSQGRPHISYYDNSTSVPLLNHAWWTGTAWNIEVVDTIDLTDSTLNFYPHSSIALDGDDHPHIAYISETHIFPAKVVVKYAHWTGTTWLLENIDSMRTDDWTWYSAMTLSLCLDSSGNPHICYAYGETDSFPDVDAMRYARWTGGLYGWEIQTVETGFHHGISLALDADDGPHISHINDNNLKYTKKTGGFWSTTTVDTITPSGFMIGGDITSIALDTLGNPCISYMSRDPDQLKYAKWTGSAWSIQTVDTYSTTAINPYMYSSLAIDSQNQPHIAYFEEDNDNLKHAWTSTSGGGWFTETVDASQSVGLYPSIAIDASDNLHISYYDSYWENLKYARTPDEYFNDFSFDPFDSNSDGFWDSLQVDMDVDTTYSGSVNVFVYAYLRDIANNIVAFDDPLWSITSNAEEWGQAILSVPAGAPEGLYDVELYLFDADNNYEDYRLFTDVIYLYPPDMRELTVQVTGSGTTEPAPGNWWVPNGTVFPVDALPSSGWQLDHWLLDSVSYPPDDPFPVTMDADHVLSAVFAAEAQTGWLQGTVTDFDTGLPLGADVYVGEYEDYVTSTNATGQYSAAFLPGDYVITVKDSESSIYNSQTVTVTIVADTITTRDFQLVRSNWVLSIQTSGMGTTDPAPASYTWPKDTFFSVEALPNEGWRLSYWLLDSVEAGSGNPIEVFMDADHNLTAVFADEALIASMIESCNLVGDQKDFFDLGETIFVTGSGYALSTTYNLYVVADIDWSNGMSIPTRISGTSNNVTSNNEGAVPSTVVWSNPQTIGKYDIVVDVNGNGVYDAGVDALDNSDVEVTAGMVIPEISPFLFLIFFILLTLFTVFTSKGHKKNK